MSGSSDSFVFDKRSGYAQIPGRDIKGSPSDIREKGKAQIKNLVCQYAYMQCFRLLGSNSMTDSYLRSLQDLTVDKLISSRLSTKREW